MGVVTDLPVLRVKDSLLVLAAFPRHFGKKIIFIFLIFFFIHHITNLLLTEREGHTGEYWPEVVTVRTERSEVRTKTTEGQYSPVRPEQAR